MATLGSSIRICWLVTIVLGNGVLTDSVLATPPTDWKSLSQSTSFAEWREDHRGWTVVGDVMLNSKLPRRFDLKSGRGALVGEGSASNLETREEYGDVDVKLTFVIPKQSNTGVKLMGRYEIQIRDSHDATNLSGDSCGGIYPRAERQPHYHHIDHGIPPRINASKPAGEWQTLEISFIAPRFDATGKKTSNAKFASVVLNQKLIHENVEVLAPTGAAWRLVKEVPHAPLLLQGDHGPVAFREIQIRPHN